MTETNTSSANTRKRSRKPLIITAAIAVYALVIAYVNRDIWLVEHDYLRYFGSLGAEAIVIVVLYIFLRKREALRMKK